MNKKNITPKQTQPVLRPAQGTRADLHEEEIQASQVSSSSTGVEPGGKDPCYSKRNCNGKVIGHYAHCHNCKQRGGKSIRRSNRCEKC